MRLQFQIILKFSLRLLFSSVLIWIFDYSCILLLFNSQVEQVILDHIIIGQKKSIGNKVWHAVHVKFDLKLRMSF